MSAPTPLSKLATQQLFGKGDVFVLFGELFGRGYANGLVNEVRAAGMTIIGMTVGRREADNTLRPLNAEELGEAEANLGGRIINVPLMAGFDLDRPDDGPTVTDLTGEMSLKTWATDKLDWDRVTRCRQVGTQRFKSSVQEALRQLDALIPAGANVLFAHTMAGGLVKSKVFFAVANRVYKGRGERFVSSRALLDSDLGKLNLLNFEDVTANTFGTLLEESKAIAARVAKEGGQVRYSAYGYHGTGILIDDQYQWQTYTNYTHGYAKAKLEEHARNAWARGVKATVFNCPEIRTNSSDIFVGVELSLFPLLQAYRREGCGAWGEAQWDDCRARLTDPAALEGILATLNTYNTSETMKYFRDFDAWPMDNTQALAELMIATADEITEQHKSRRELITDLLSAQVIEATGPLIFNELADPEGPVLWLNHDVIARKQAQLHS